MWHLITTLPFVSKPLNSVRLKRWRAQADEIIRLSETLQPRTDDELLIRAGDLRWRAKGGEPLESLMVEAFALVRESARRTFGFMHHPVQIMGATAMFEGHIAEMQTGEGKTLTATLAAFARALPGRGCHVITVNDYLAERDANTMRPLYGRLGMTTGCILASLENDDDARRAGYACDITYGTAKEMGFDFLRDRMKRESTNPFLGRRASEHGWSHGFGSSKPGDGAKAAPASGPVETDAGAQAAVATLSLGPRTKAASASQPSFDMGTEGGERPVHRGFHFALIDEADSILIDEARTPLVIGLVVQNAPSTLALLQWSRALADKLDPETEFIFHPERRSVELTEAGCRRVVLCPKPALLDGIETEKLYESVEQAATATYGFHRDRDYVVRDEEVTIVDESTGRVMDGRKWEEGLHQAIEMKEQVTITPATGQAARVTVQTFFREYTHLAGMTGTASPAARELRHTFDLKVSVIPTHRPCLRQGFPTRIFATQRAKWHAVAVEIQRLQNLGRAILVGTPSVRASEALAEALIERGLPHVVLNARFDAQEADIVKDAGEPGRVTIATNMAGRGTDIHLAPSVREAGGLHVIATEMHSSARIDRQLIGRSARQGDPGSYQFFLSLEDELLHTMPKEKLAQLRAAAGDGSAGELPASWISVIQKTQRKLERLHAKHRREVQKAERRKRESHRKMGLDPCLELTD